MHRFALTLGRHGRGNAASFGPAPRQTWPNHAQAEGEEKGPSPGKYTVAEDGSMSDKPATTSATPVRR